MLLCPPPSVATRVSAAHRRLWGGGGRGKAGGLALHGCHQHGATLSTTAEARQASEHLQSESRAVQTVREGHTRRLQVQGKYEANRACCSLRFSDEGSRAQLPPTFDIRDDNRPRMAPRY